MKSDTLRVKNLGNIYNSSYNGSSYGGYVYDKNYLCPCLDTCQGGGRTPMTIVEVEVEECTS